jgi:hypothetical protein
LYTDFKCSDSGDQPEKCGNHHHDTTRAKDANSIAGITNNLSLQSLRRETITSTVVGPEYDQRQQSGDKATDEQRTNDFGSANGNATMHRVNE